MAHQTFFNLLPEKQKKIIACAIDEFIAWPYDKTNINRIIENAGIAKGSFYQYFENKDDLYTHCMTSMYEKVFALRRQGSNAYLYDALLNGILQSSAQEDTEFISLLGERNYRFIQSITHAPKQVRSNVILNVTLAISLPFVKKELQEDPRIRPDADLDFYAYLISMSEFIAMEYGVIHMLSLEEMKRYSWDYMRMVYAAIMSEEEILPEDEKRYRR